MKLDFRLIIVVLLLGGTIIYTNVMSHGEPVPITRPLKEFPEQIGDWKSTTHFFSKEVYDILGVDDSTLRNYRDDNGNLISLYIGYYESQKEGEIIHSPKNCMLGSGWQPLEISRIEIDTPSGKIPLSKMIVEKGLQKEIVLYWYQTSTDVIANEYLQRINFVWDAIRYNRTNAAFIRFTSPVLNNDYEKTIQIEIDFIKEVIPLLNNFLPQS